MFVFNESDLLVWDFSDAVFRTAFDAKYQPVGQSTISHRGSIAGCY